MDQTDKPLNVAYMQNRELSWLDFNKRVLDQGADRDGAAARTPELHLDLLEQPARVLHGARREPDRSFAREEVDRRLQDGHDPRRAAHRRLPRCRELYPYYEEAPTRTCAGFYARAGHPTSARQELTVEQLSYIDDYVHASVLPILSPSDHQRAPSLPHLENGALYIVVRLDEEASARRRKRRTRARRRPPKTRRRRRTSGGGRDAGLIPLPRQCERVVKLPGKGLQFVLLEHVIEMYAAEIFSMYSVKHTNIICVTRNADLDATEGGDEQDEDYREHMKRILKKRARLAPVRLECETELSSTIKPLLLDRLNLKEHQVFRHHGAARPQLHVRPRLACRAETPPPSCSRPSRRNGPACLDRNRSIIEQVSEHEVLMNYPYESMEAFVQLLREAAADPAVASIKITLYRLASQSHLAEALIAAAEAGKEVTALFELRARFDESNNIEWSQRFEQAGCHVIYGFRDFKVHSKICTITRQTDSGISTSPSSARQLQREDGAALHRLLLHHHRSVHRPRRRAVLPQHGA